MKSVSQVMTALKSKGTEQTRKTYVRHGAVADFFGVKVADMKVIAKQIKGNQQLACELYQTGNGDAMYLAGLVANGAQMTREQLDSWAQSASWRMIAEYTVPWVAAESPYGREMAMKWIKSKDDSVASTGWGTYAGVVATTPDDQLDLAEIANLLKHIEVSIGKAAGRVRYTMNGFVIAVGGYVKPLSKQAKATARKLGRVDVDMGDTDCKVPFAIEYIEKMETSGRAFKKRKSFKC